MAGLTTAVPPAVVALAAAVAVTVAPRRVGHAVALAGLAAAVPWVLSVPAGTHLPATLFGFEVVLFRVDGVARAVGAVFLFVAVADVCYLYGTGSGRRDTAVALAYVGASLGAVFAGDWLTLVVWWELMALAATALVWQTPEAVRAGYRYAVYHQLGGALLTAGVLLHYVAAGTFVFENGVAGGLPRLLSTLGVLVNVGMVGLHVWLVDTYPRPSVAASVVLCAFTTKVGVYALVRVLPGRSLALAYAGAAMLLFGVTMAVLQTDLRRLLSYHIVSQVGYMVAGVGIATPLGYGGATVHLVNNVVYKSLLFMIGGVIVLRTGTENLKKLGGLARAMPATAAAFAAAALAISGVPGFAGFVSKGMVFDAAQRADLDLLWWLLLVGGVGTVVSFAKFGYYAFGRAGKGDSRAMRTAAETDSSPATTAALALLAVPCVAFGLAPDLLLELAPTGATAAKPYSVSQLQKAAAVALAGLVGFAIIRESLARLTAVPDLDAVYHPAGARLRDAVVALAVRTGESASHAGTAVAREAIRVALADETTDRLPDSTIGRGVLLVAAVTALLLAALLV